jgi:hypothetical protein
VPQAPPAPGAPPRRPSLLLITLDTTRDDAVGRVDGGSPGTPNLDALARGGTRFANAVSPAPLTFPAHCSLMTGLNPPQHGIRDNGIGVLGADLPTVASVLAARGYTTAAFVSSRVLDRRFGLDRGFATYDDRLVAEKSASRAIGGERGRGHRRRPRLVGRPTLKGAGAVFPLDPLLHPHAPPPGGWSESRAQRYAGGVAFVTADRPPSPPSSRPAGASRRRRRHGRCGRAREKEHGTLLSPRGPQFR